MHSNSKDLDPRREDAKNVRNATRDHAFNEFETDTPNSNEDEQRFQDLDFPGFASFTKALSHNSANGLVDLQSFHSLLKAIESGTQAAFEKVELGGSNRLLANPLNAYSFQLIGNDSHSELLGRPAFFSRFCIKHRFCLY